MIKMLGYSLSEHHQEMVKVEVHGGELAFSNMILTHSNHFTTSGRNATLLSVLLGDLNLIAESTE
jgi:hypothetical protein